MVTIDKTSAQILASLVIEDVREYIKNHPDEYAAFCAAKKEKEQQQAAPVKRRRKRHPKR